VAPHEGATHIFGQALTSTHHQSQTRTPRPPDQHHTTGLANADYDLTVVFLLASKDSRTTSLLDLIVLLLGGIMNGGRTKVFASWKRVMTRGIYNLMLKRLSLCLLQARARSFELQGFIPP
jgi:hypothetical protein